MGKPCSSHEKIRSKAKGGPGTELFAELNKQQSNGIMKAVDTEEDDLVVAPLEN